MPFPYSDAFVAAVQDLLAPEKGHIFFNRYLASEISGTRTEQICGSQLAVLNRIVPLQNKKVLDFGCGTGQSLVGLGSAGARVTGIEPGKKRLDVAALRLKEHGIDISRVEMIHVPDTTRLPFEDNTFDVCFCNAVLEHIPGDRSPCLREMWRVLKVNGVLSISETPNRLWPYDYHTTELLWIPWMPAPMARAYALFRGRHLPHLDLESMGRRGTTYGDIIRALPLESYAVTYPPKNAEPATGERTAGTLRRAKRSFLKRAKGLYAHFKRVPFHVFASEVAFKCTGVPPVAFQKVIDNLNLVKLK